MDHYTRVGAYGLVVKQTEEPNNKKVLLCRLSSQVPQWQGQWTLPGGGLEFGESPEHAMVREVEEETGMIVTPEVVVATNAIAGEFDGRKYHSVRIIYTTTIVGGELRFEVSGSTDRCEWFTTDQLTDIPLVALAADALPLI